MESDDKASVGCCLFGKKKDPPPFKQTLVILRHSERLDHVDPKSYQESAEGKAWPFDTPLTENGIKLAKEVAAQLAELHKTAKFAIVASSPYRRCMQTAAEVAKLLNLPVLIDQEVGEVWEAAMPADGPPHRSPTELKEMSEELGIRVSNPMLEEGGYKFFGKRPQTWPETLEMGHKRCIVRMETYIEQSVANKQNFIIVSHAHAVAAMMDLFNRGNADIEKLEYCARVIATRNVSAKGAQAQQAHGVYGENWEVDCKGVEMGINIDATEEDHLKACEEAKGMATKRQQKRTKTDAMFDENLIKMLQKEGARIDEEEAEAEAGGAAHAPSQV